MSDFLDDAINPVTILQLGKKELHLAFTMNSVLAFQDKTGRNLYTAEGWQNFTLRDDPAAILAFFWACLIPNHPEITYVQAGNMATLSNMNKIAEACEKTLRANMPEADVGEETPTTAAPKSVGLTSGA